MNVDVDVDVFDEDGVVKWKRAGPELGTGFAHGGSGGSRGRGNPGEPGRVVVLW